MPRHSASNLCNPFRQPYKKIGVAARARKLWAWLTYIRTDDPLRRVLNRGFAAVSVGMILVSTVTAVYFIQSDTAVTSIAIAGIAFCALAWWLNRRGTVLGAILFVVWSSFAIALASVPTGSVRENAPIPLLMIVPVITATLFIRPRAGVAALLLVMTLLGIQLWLTPLPREDITRYLVIATLDLAVVTMLLVVGAAIFSRALRRSIAASQQLQQDIARRELVERDLQLREQHSRSLLQLSQELERAQTYAQALEAALNQVKSVTGYQNLWVYLMSPDKESFRALLARGQSAQPAVEELTILTIRGDRMLEEIAEATHTVVVEDARTDERTDKVIVNVLGIRTIINIPILLFDRHLGTMGTGTFGEEGVHAPTPAELEYLAAIASHMAVTLDRIHLLLERQTAEKLRAGQNEILEGIARSAPLQDTLTQLALLIEQQAQGLLCSVVLLDQDGKHLRHFAAPTLPRAYTQSIDGLEIGPRAGSCGTAMFLGKPVIATDILQDPLWDKYRARALTYDLRACWATPFFSHSGQVLGSFAMYYREPRAPTSAEEHLIELATNIAGIAVERKQVETALRIAEQKYRAIFENAVEGIYQSTPDGRVLNVNPALAHLLGYASPSEFTTAISDLAIQCYVDPKQREHFMQLMQEAGEVHNLEYEAYRKDGTKIWVSDSARAVFGGHGELLYFEGFLTDITARKHIEQAEQEQRALNARLLDQARQRADEFAALYETARDLAAQSSLEAILNTILERALKLFAVPFGSIYLYDATRGNLELISITGLGHPTGTRVELGEGIAGRAALARETIIVDDYANWEKRSPRFADAPLTTAICVPMLYGGELIGTIILAELAPSTRKFTEADQRLLSLFASQAASAVHDAHLSEQTHHRLAELEAVNQISKRLRGARTVEEMLPSLLDETLKVMASNAGGIWLYQEQDGKLHNAIARGWIEELDEPPVEPGEGILGSVFRTGEPYASKELGTDPLVLADLRARLPRHWGGVCVPIRTLQQVIGVLCVAVPSPRDTPESQVQLLGTIAEIAGNAIHRTRLQMQTERRLERLVALKAIDASISSILNLPITLNILLEQVILQLRVDAADILLVNSYTQFLTYAAGLGFSSRRSEQTMFRVGESLAGRAAMERRIVVIPNLAEAGSTFGRGDVPAKEGFVAYYGAPLIAKGKVLGVLEIFHRAPLATDAEWLDFLEALAKQAAIAIDNTELFESLQRSNQELGLAYDATIKGWSRALDLRDRETEGHTRRVTELSERLARLLGFSDEELVHVRRGALLHDIGKMGIPDSILFKPGRLTPEEWELMRKHPTYAYEMLYPIKYLRPALDIPYCHHERWDGSGYPRGLKGEQIPLAARIFTVVDVWDALRSNRPYRKAWNQERVREYIRTMSGIHFDPFVTQVFLELEAELSP